MTQSPDDSAPQLLKQHGEISGKKRDTAMACRARSDADLLESVSMQNAHRRSILEQSAAAWSLRADQLQRHEARLAEKAPASPEIEHVRR